MKAKRNQRIRLNLYAHKINSIQQSKHHYTHVHSSTEKILQDGKEPVENTRKKLTWLIQKVHFISAYTATRHHYTIFMNRGW